MLDREPIPPAHPTHRRGVTSWVRPRVSLPLPRIPATWQAPTSMSLRREIRRQPQHTEPPTQPGRLGQPDTGRPRRWRAGDSRDSRNGERGQGIVEFALVFPIFVLMFMATIEFGLAFNAVLNVNFASRNATLLAAEAGNSAGADCVILQSIEDDIGTPASDTGIESVDIYWADPDGTVKSGKVNHYIRGGSTKCSYNDGTDLTVPYTLAVGGYVDTTRCNTLKGCGSGHTALDTIGVSITYRHNWRTPMAAIIPGVGPASGFSFVRSNAMRMEPIL